MPRFGTRMPSQTMMIKITFSKSKGISSILILISARVKRTKVKSLWRRKRKAKLKAYRGRAHRGRGDRNCLGALPPLGVPQPRARVRAEPHKYPCGVARWAVRRCGSRLRPRRRRVHPRAKLNERRRSAIAQGSKNCDGRGAPDAETKCPAQEEMLLEAVATETENRRQLRLMMSEQAAQRRRLQQAWHDGRAFSAVPF